MKKLFLLMIPILLYGCSHDMNRREIDEINIVHVIGIDYLDGEFIISVLYSSDGGADSEESGVSSEEEIISGTGRTPYEALEDVKFKNKKNITLAHTGSFQVKECFPRY